MVFTCLDLCLESRPVDLRGLGFTANTHAWSFCRELWIFTVNSCAAILFWVQKVRGRVEMCSIRRFISLRPTDFFWRKMALERGFCIFCSCWIRPLPSPCPTLWQGELSEGHTVSFTWQGLCHRHRGQLAERRHLHAQVSCPSSIWLKCIKMPKKLRCLSKEPKGCLDV